MVIKEKYQKIGEESKVKKGFKEQAIDEVNKRYKTELCKNWSEGKCNFGESCIFAHGENELVKVDKKICKQYQNYGYCLKGNSCVYIHKEREKGKHERLNGISQRKLLVFNSINWEAALFNQMNSN